MRSLDDLQRAFFDGLYTFRVPVALLDRSSSRPSASLLAWRAGWFAAARRHPGRAGALARGRARGRAAADLLPRVADLDPDRAHRAGPGRRGRLTARRHRRPPPRSTPIASPSAAPSVRGALRAPAPTPFAARTLASGPFHGTDDFHFGRGTATIIETAPGTLHAAVRRLLGPQRPGPLRLPLARRLRLRRWRARARPAQGDRRRLRLRAAGRHRPGRLRQRDHLVQAVLAPLRGRSAGAA